MSHRKDFRLSSRPQTLDRISICAALVLHAHCLHADNLDRWRWRNPLPTGENLNAIVFGSGQFVAVGDKRTIVTSSDGSNWVSLASGNKGRLLSVAHGDGAFVAVGEVGLILATTTNGLWHKATSPSNVDLYEVTYGSGKFVAVGDLGTILSSDDGQTWIQTQSPTTNHLRQVVFAEGRFVILGEVAPNLQVPLLISTNAADWSLDSVVSPGRPLTDIAFADGAFSLVGQRVLCPSILTLTASGFLWSHTNIDTGLNLKGLAFGSGKSVAVGIRDPTVFDGVQVGVILRSNDKTTWSIAASFNTRGNGLRAVAFGLDRFVSVGDHGCIYFSTDTTNWLSGRKGFANDLTDIIYADQTFVTVGKGGMIARSTDGAVWEHVTVPVTNDLFGLAYGAGNFVAVGANGTILTSMDSRSWVPRLSGATDLLQAIAWGDDKFVTVSLAGAVIVSTNATDWFAPGTKMRAAWRMRHLNGLFVAVGYNLNGSLQTSPDGVNWLSRPPGSDFGLFDAVRYNDEFIVIGRVSKVVRSTNGVDWVGEQIGWEWNFLEGIARGDDQLVVVGWNAPNREGLILSSSDTHQWSNRLDRVSAYLHSVAYGDGVFVAVGDQGTILQSSRPPQLRATLSQSNGVMAIQINGELGALYTLQATEDFVSWIDLGSITNSEALPPFLDPILPPRNERYYRAVEP